MSHKKFGPDRFSRFDVYWIQTDRQTDKETDKPNLYIEGGKELELYIYMYEMERNWSCIYIRWKGIGVVYIGWKETGVVYI